MQSDIILTDGICPLITIMRASDRCQYIGCSGKRHFDFQRETAYARMRMNTSQSNSDGSGQGDGLRVVRETMNPEMFFWQWGHRGL